jgi:Zn-dependent protease with chaperone function
MLLSRKLKHWAVNFHPVQVLLAVMRTLSNKTSLFIFGAIFFFLFSFSLIFPAHAVLFISKKKEIEIGRSGDEQIVLQFGIYQDKSLQLYVNTIGQKLVSKLSNKEFRKFHFKLVDSSEINAFALPGGYVYVTRGLLAALNNESELASVIGHEIAHVTLHHGAKLMIRSIGAQIFSVAGAIASPENAFISELSTNLKWNFLNSLLESLETSF